MKIEVELKRNYHGSWSATIPGSSANGFKSREEALRWADWMVRAAEYDRTAKPEIVEIDTEAIQ